MCASIRDVADFWERNPLFQGESEALAGSKGFFAEHNRVYVEDCFAGSIDSRLFPRRKDIGVLDAGCGIGFWTEQFVMRGYERVDACDPTQAGLNLTAKRLANLGRGAEVTLAKMNVEELGYASEEFDHVNCQGVVHHTPNAAQAVRELHRVTRLGGTGVISVYYRGPLLRSWPWVARALAPGLRSLGLKGRGREHLLGEQSPEELVRKYDGADNPIGVAFTRHAFLELLKPWRVDETFIHFFPARSLPSRVPRPVHRLLDRRLGLMIFARLTRVQALQAGPAEGLGATAGDS